MPIVRDLGPARLLSEPLLLQMVHRHLQGSPFDVPIALLRNLSNQDSLAKLKLPTSVSFEMK